MRRKSKMSNLPRLSFAKRMNSQRLTTRSSYGLQRKDMGEEITEEDLDALPTIDEMAANFNYQKNMQPFDLMDNDLRRLVEDLKKRKRNESNLMQHMNLRSKRSKKARGKKGRSIFQSKSQSNFRKKYKKKVGFQEASTEMSGSGKKLDKKKSTEDVNLLGLDLKPKYKRARSVVNGSLSILLNIKNNKKTRNFMNFDHDLDEEILKLKVSMRKEIPYEELNMGGENKMKLKRLSSNNKMRMRMIKEFLKGNQELIKKLKLNSQILNNWLSYVGYLSKPEFISALSSIGLKYEKKLFDKIFWLYDLNGDGVIDHKEFCLISSLFRGRSIAEKVKMFFNACDPDNDGYIDVPKIKRLVLLGLTEQEQARIALGKQPGGMKKKLVNSKTKEMVALIRPQKKSDIRTDDVVKACQRNSKLVRIIDYYLNIPDLFKIKTQKFSVASFLHNQTLISHEGTHLNYMKEFISAISNKEKINDRTSKLVSRYAYLEEDEDKSGYK